MHRQFFLLPRESSSALQVHPLKEAGDKDGLAHICRLSDWSWPCILLGLAPGRLNDYEAVNLSRPARDRDQKYFEHAEYRVHV